MNNILQVTGLNKSYKNFSLTDVSFTLLEDCITGFIGINGAGKTVSFSIPMVYLYFSNVNIDFSMLESIPVAIKNTVLALACIVALGVSQGASVRIFSKKDL